MSKITRKFQVLLSEANFAALKVISSIANGACEITVIKGEISVIKPTSQRIDLQREEERAAILDGSSPGTPVDMSKWIGTTPEVVKVIEPNEEEAAQ
jgi:hypothetical protein